MEHIENMDCSALEVGSFDKNKNKFSEPSLFVVSQTKLQTYLGSLKWSNILILTFLHLTTFLLELPTFSGRIQSK